MTRRLTKDELDRQFELFLKESVSDESVDLGEKSTSAKDKSEARQKATVSWWEEDDDEDKPKPRFLKASKRQTDEAEGAAGSGRRFLRSLPKSQTIREEDESTDQNLLERSTTENAEAHGSLVQEDSLREEALVQKDSLREEALVQEDSLRVEALVQKDSLMGADTLDELQEKERFFAELEAGASSTIDYSKLNRDLESSASTEHPGPRKTEDALEEADRESHRKTPGSRCYSDDFEDEVKEPEQKPKISPILAKVSFYDSLDDTRDDERQKLTSTTTTSLDRAQSGAPSGGSDLEALREALQIHMVQDSQELHRTFSSPKAELPRPPSAPSAQIHTSTIESDLPTAEELLKPIRPEDKDQDDQEDQEDVRGFSPSVQDSVGTVLQRKPSGETDPLLTPDPPLTQDQPRSVHQEVHRLLQEAQAQDGRTKRPAQVQARPQDSRTTARASSALGPGALRSKSKTSRPLAPPPHSTSRPSAPPPHSTSRPSAPPPHRTSRPSAPPPHSTFRPSAPHSTFRPSAPPPHSTSRPSAPPPHRTRASKTPERTKTTSDGSDLVTSVQSLVSVLQQQLDLRVSDPTVDLPPGTMTEQRPLVDDLKALLLQKENLIEKLKLDSEKLTSVQQQNFILQSQMHSAQDALQKFRRTNSSDPEKLQQMDKELKEQEALIQGYQQENERLYLQLKNHTSRTKANEDAMFKENQLLLGEVALIREQLKAAQRPVSNLCSMDHSQRINQLLQQVQELQTREKSQNEELQNLKLEKQALEVDLQLLRDRTSDRTRAEVEPVEQSHRAQVEQSHRAQVVELKKKLTWFAENQELLDRDAARLRAATAETLQLKEQVQKLQREVSRRTTRERSADARRTRDLERQVKELEQLLRCRKPNSLPALMLAAACAPERPLQDAPGPGVTALLERRVQRLEAELEAHDEEAQRRLRSVQQQFQSLRMRYEQQISELEQRLQQKQQVEQEEVQEVEQKQQVEQEVEASDLEQRLRDQLRREREVHQEKLTTLQQQLESLQQQLKVKSGSSPSRHQRQAEAAVGLRIERLNQELSTKTRTIQDLTRTLDRLQRERRSLGPAPGPRETRAEPRAETRRPAVASRGPVPEQDTETFPTLSHKAYLPTEFTDSHISEVLQENEALRQKLQQLQSDSEQQREELQTTLSRTQEQLHRLQEDHSQQMSSVQAQVLREQAELRSTFALEQVHALQIRVEHLQQQLTEAQSCRDALRVSRLREDALQRQLGRVLEDLKEARDNHSPEMKLLKSLETKLQDLETRHHTRDQQVMEVMGAGLSDQVEVQRWKRAVQEKTRELDCFRLELDSILDILRHLQQQGVVLQAPPLPAR